MLGKLKNAASMAISVTTGRKISVKKNQNASNVIPGFGYALMDIFENQRIIPVTDWHVECCCAAVRETLVQQLQAVGSSWGQRVQDLPAAEKTPPKRGSWPNAGAQ